MFFKPIDCLSIATFAGKLEIHFWLGVASDLVHKNSDIFDSATFFPDTASAHEKRQGIRIFWNPLSREEKN